MQNRMLASQYNQLAQWFAEEGAAAETLACLSAAMELSPGPMPTVGWEALKMLRRRGRASSSGSGILTGRGIWPCRPSQATQTQA